LAARSVNCRAGSVPDPDLFADEVDCLLHMEAFVAEGCFLREENRTVKM
jgi:hypothetical protein